ncbi:potassium channel family protein [Bacterioplanoides sp.]|uniref:potassium channel family protein n=1 Tax=Bacterioplanoides sp. TaxID=2066072 RepID=UPI003B5C2CAC
MISKLIEQKPKFYGWAYIILVIAYFLIYCFFHYDLGLPSSWVDSAYLSLVTITTLGFGDITPNTDVGKIIVSSQAFFGVMILGLFLNSLSHERSKSLSETENQIEENRKEELRKSLEMHSCLLLDVFKSANPFAWDKHAKYSTPMDDLEDFCRSTYSTINTKQSKVDELRTKMLLETVDQNYDTLLSLTPVAAEISSEYLLEWSSLLSNVRNLKQQYERTIEATKEGGSLNWPSNDDICLQVKELIQTSLFISKREKIPDE